MVNNQTEFNEKYNDKEIDEIEIKRKNFQGQLIIEGYPKLEEVYLYNVSNIEKIKLKDLPQLQKCTIRGCGVKDLIINNCSQIEELNVESNLLTSLEFIKELPSLQRLEVDGNTTLELGLECLPKDLKKFSCENTKFPSLQQKYENLKGIITSVAKEAKKEILKGIEAKEEALEQGDKVIKTDEIVVNLTKGVEGLKEVKKELETNLKESEKKIQKLEKELVEAEDRSEKRQNKIEELSKEHSLEKINQIPINEKTIIFLRTKSVFLNTRQETIGELKKCFIALENNLGKHDIIGEVGSVISGVGGAFNTVTLGIPMFMGEAIKAGNSFSQIILTKKGNEEFQLSLKDGKELVKLHEDYDSLVSLIHNSEILEEKSYVNVLNLKGRTRDGKARAFNTDYEIFNILESKSVWKHRKLTLERMEISINALSENHRQLESEWEEQFEKVKIKLGKEKANLFSQEQEIQAQIHHLQNQLEELKNSVKNKLKSTHWREKEKRNKEREIILSNFLKVQVEIIRSGDTTDRQTKLFSLQHELLKIVNEHKYKEFKSELDDLCQVQRELIESQMDLESLQQAQIEFPPKN